jgi:superfamily II DNA or RNA helicase
VLKYRPYQATLVDGIQSAWLSGHRNVLAVLPTGGGKTVVFSGILAAECEPSIAIAHRQELVGQMSVALARNGVKHRIIAPHSVIKRIVYQHVQGVGRSFFEPRANCAVAGVDTLIRKGDQLNAWLSRVKLWVVDEGHHLLQDNKWGKAVAMFPNARGLGVTATPTRADGRGLGAHSDGLFHDLIIGPTMRELIIDRWLTDYRIFCPQGDFHRPDTPEAVGSTGDFKPAVIKAAVRQSHIVGDVVAHYQRIAPGKLGVTFAGDVETATDIAQQFRAAGVACEVVSAKTPDQVRAQILHRFRRRELTMLVNVDLFGEGFDLPAIEVVIMARPTESFGLYAQQFGRALRPLEGKERAIIIDHVGNVVRHGLPDAHREWTLDARDRKSRGTPDDVVPIRACLNVECMQVYERFLPVCPYCGHKPEPASRSAPEFVDGDLTELDPAVLAILRGEVAAVDQPAIDYRAELAAKGCPTIGQHAHVKRHLERQEAQQALRTSMAWWAGHHKAAGRSDAESYRRFWHAFGVDALTAQVLGTAEALALAERINDEIVRMG